MIVQLVEDICYNTSAALNGKILKRISSRTCLIEETDNRLTSIAGNKFTGLNKQLQFKHTIKKNEGKWESKVVDLVDKTEVLIAHGYFVRGEDLI